MSSFVAEKLKRSFMFLDRINTRTRHNEKYGPVTGPGGVQTELVNDHWLVREEAKAFLGMVIRGQMNVDMVKHDILMSDSQFQSLVSTTAAPTEMLIRIRVKRELTWITFLDLYRQAFPRGPYDQTFRAA
jgi:hypothetical protein